MIMKSMRTTFYKKPFIALALFSSLISPTLAACALCHTPSGKALRDSIFNNNFFTVFGMIFLLFLIYTLSVSMIYNYCPSKLFNKNTSSEVLYLKEKKPFEDTRSLFSAGMFLGAGLIGFLDSILFHQIFQLHGMVSNRLHPDLLLNIQVNMFWDGIFQAFSFMTLLAGLSMLWKAVKNEQIYKSTHIFLGAIFLGAGIFNLLEGLLNHHILKLHHVVQGTTSQGQYSADMTMLLFALILIFIGISTMRKENRLIVK